MRVTKPKSSVKGDVPRVLLNRYPYQYAKPVTIIYKKIIQSSTWPKQWLEEQAVVLSKLKSQQLPQIEDDLHTVSKTAWLSKCFENILGDFILPTINKYIDPGQCEGLKKSLVSHYLVRLLDFAHSALDKNIPHCLV